MKKLKKYFCTSRCYKVLFNSVLKFVHWRESWGLKLVAVFSDSTLGFVIRWIRAMKSDPSTVFREVRYTFLTCCIFYLIRYIRDVLLSAQNCSHSYQNPHEFLYFADFDVFTVRVWPFFLWVSYWVGIVSQAVKHTSGKFPHFFQTILQSHSHDSCTYSSTGWSPSVSVTMNAFIVFHR